MTEGNWCWSNRLAKVLGAESCVAEEVRVPVWWRGGQIVEQSKWRTEWPELLMGRTHREWMWKQSGCPSKGRSSGSRCWRSGKPSEHFPSIADLMIPWSATFDWPRLWSPYPFSPIGFAASCYCLWQSWNDCIWPNTLLNQTQKMVLATHVVIFISISYFRAKSELN